MKKMSEVSHEVGRENGMRTQERQNQNTETDTSSGLGSASPEHCSLQALVIRIRVVYSGDRSVAAKCRFVGS